MIEPESGPQTTFIDRIGLVWQTFPEEVHVYIWNVIVCSDADVSRSRDNYVDDDYVKLFSILMFKGVNLVLILFITEWEPITQFEDAVVSVGRVKIYALDVKSPIYRVLSGLFAFVHDTPEDVHTDAPPILIGITWL